MAAKVTRDACVEGWHFEEAVEGSEAPWTSGLGSGYPSGKNFDYFVFSQLRQKAVDPNTQAWLKTAIDPVFGFPKIARFSWNTVKLLLDKSAHAVKW